MLKVWGRATSLNVQAVLWTAAELGLAVERIDAGFGFGVTDTPEYRAMNPNGLVPVLRDENVTMFESAAIARYLCARYARFPFWPEDPVARAPVDMWAEWGKTTLQPSFLRPVFFPVLIGEGGPGTPAWEKARAEFERNLDILEGQLGEGPWITGADFTLADVEVGLPLYRYYTLEGLPRAERPRLQGYYDRLNERPGYAHVAVSYDVLRSYRP
ncbi:glutathione S-transferase family protein [Amaricoccus sp.]|uniref:glutathione S-transferase family protein n=1 Tax=Amaricoccus sp. TaxID=1872485 RepID=UPI001B715CF8|nr:glutathione S-transferase family protein [Amaricoccus sp.]MBP7000798.1 glutathione S-transferase family protein [Amaricoccus sp.]